MFVMESWPDATTAPGPRIAASADSRILADIMKPVADIIVWSRKVPDTWPDLIGQTTTSSPALTLSGTVGDITRTLRHQLIVPENLRFLKEDIEQTLSLTAALSGAQNLCLTWQPVTTPLTPVLSGTSPFCVFCLYGGGELSVSYNDAQQHPTVLTPDPHALTFCCPRLHAPLHLHIQKDQTQSCFALIIEVMETRGASLY